MAESFRALRPQTSGLGTGRAPAEASDPGQGFMLPTVSIDPGVAFLLIIYLLLLGKVVGLRQTVQRWCRGTPKLLGRHSRYSRHAEAWHGHGGNWHHSLGATEEEQAAIEDAKARLPADALALSLGRALACGDPAFEMELLRRSGMSR